MKKADFGNVKSGERASPEHTSPRKRVMAHKDGIFPGLFFREPGSMTNSMTAVRVALRYFPKTIPCHLGGLLVQDVAELKPTWKFIVAVYCAGGESLVPAFAQKAGNALRAQGGGPSGIDNVITSIEKGNNKLSTTLRNDAELNSFVSLPLVIHKRTIGIIGIGSALTDAFSESQIGVLSTLAGYLATVISSAQLFEQVSLEKRRLETAINRMSDGLIMTDRDHHVTIFNPALEKMTSIRARDVIGKPLEKLKPLIQFLNQAEQPDQPQQTDEPIPKVLKLSPAAAIDGPDKYSGEIQVIHDVSQEREIARMKSEFVASVSHELRTPLHSIRGFNKLMLEGKVPDPETQKEFLTIIDEQSEHLTKLVNNLIDVSSIEAGQFKIQKQRLSLESTIHRVVGALYSLVTEKNININLVIQGHLPDVDGDAERLTQVLTNLIGNAIKFSDNSSQITVKAKVKDSEVLVQISDHGIGIPAEAIPHLFERFYRARDPLFRGGAGLGLYITRQIIEKHGGHIWVESQVDKGSVFSFTIPIFASP